MADTVDLLHDVLVRLDALERDNARLRERNDQLEQAVAALLDRPAAAMVDQADDLTPEPLSRRHVLRRGLQVAAASLATGVLLHETTQDAAADDFSYVRVNQPNNTNAIYATSPGPTNSTINAESASGVALRGETNGSRAAVFGWNKATGPAIRGESSTANGAVEGISLNVDGVGIWGNGRIGVFGISSHGGGSGVSGQGVIGVRGTSSTDNYTAIVGEHTGTVGYGVVGVGTGAGTGVTGRNHTATGTGVKGESTGNVGVRGDGKIGVHGTSSVTNYTAVVGEHTGSVGYGVLGVGKGSGAGVTGRNSSSTGTGVKGESAGNIGVHGDGQVGVRGSSSVSNYTAIVGEHIGSVGYGVLGIGTGAGAGVVGRCNTGDAVRGEGRVGLSGIATTANGYAATLQGGKAQLRLVPSTTTGKPTSGSHQKGEIFLDKAGNIFVCIAPGTPGTWRKVSTTTA